MILIPMIIIPANQRMTIHGNPGTIIQIKTNPEMMVRNDSNDDYDDSRDNDSRDNDSRDDDSRRSGRDKK